ncbi:MAG: ribosomal protein S18-alanine N-acetyltransferase [Syntrophaceae bacterium]|nr:ribosomal protein S18-alanine N-acetyltransferase [Syntrophaceae bacterium]
MNEADIKDIIVRKMRPGDLKEVLAIEKVSFPTPWSENMFLEELYSPICYDFVATSDGEVVGYIDFLTVLDEIHLQNIAVREDRKRRKIASKLLGEMFRISSEKGINWCSLEVRKSNYAAITIYKKFGFVISGTKSCYYSDTREDALIMRAAIGKTVLTPISHLS